MNEKQNVLLHSFSSYSSHCSRVDSCSRFLPSQIDILFLMHISCCIKISSKVFLRLFSSLARCLPRAQARSFMPRKVKECRSGAQIKKKPSVNSHAEVHRSFLFHFCKNGFVCRHCGWSYKVAKKDR